jgi:hypothetical protein
MTVPEPTPDQPRPGRTTLLRRVSFATAAVALTATFGLTLSGIASTQATIEPDGPAATVAAARDAASSTVSDRHECRRGGQRARGESGRV